MLDRTEGVRKTLPADLSPDDEAAFWPALAQLNADYAALVERRKVKPPMDELKRWQRIDKLADKLGKELDDPTAVAAIKAKAADHIVINERIVKTSKGHRSLAHWFLYPGVLNLWRVQLNQELIYSRNGDKAYGDLINFFVAVVTPILGSKAPSASGIAAIIDRERKRINARKPGHASSSVEK